MTSRPELNRKRLVFAALCLAATLQFLWCYTSLTWPYLSTQLYVRGLERMPFQGRFLMVVPMRLAHGIVFSGRLGTYLLDGAMPEEAVRLLIDLVSVAVAGFFTIRLYQAASRYRLLTFAVYPVFLFACASTYILRTLQNVRYPYDLPSLAFFSAAFYLLYTRKHWIFFSALFVLATTNRETTLLLLPLYLLNEAVSDGRLQWRWKRQRGSLLLVSVLAAVWVGWQVLVRHRFAANAAETGRHFRENLYYLHDPHGLVQILSSCGFLLVTVVVLWRIVPDARLRVWVWLIPLWFGFMFLAGIIVEIRVFGELIPFATVAALLVVETLLAKRMDPQGMTAGRTSTSSAVEGHLGKGWSLLIVGVELLLAMAAVTMLLRPVHLPPPISVADEAEAIPDGGERSAILQGRAEKMLREGQVARALPLLKEATQNLSQGSTVWRDLCTAHTRLRQYDLALQACEQGLSRDPKSSAILEDVKSIRFKLEQRKIAGFSLEEVPPAMRSSSYYVSQGRFFMNASNELAARSFQKAVALDSRNTTAETELGIALMGQGRFRDAQACFERVVTLEPDNEMGRRNLSWSMQAQTSHPG